MDSVTIITENYQRPSPVSPFNTYRAAAQDPSLRQPSPALSSRASRASQSQRNSLSHPLREEQISNDIAYVDLLDGQFRLLDILPSPRTSEKLVCRMHHRYFHEHPAYAAVSYACGDRRDTATISLTTRSDAATNHAECKVITVTSSLRDALMALRHPKKRVKVWVDAISIDQSNVDELSRQVQNMDRIYQNATRVAIWLGPSSHNSALAIKTLRQMAADTNLLGSASNIRTLATSTPREAIAAIVDLFERNYWKRLWVVQEVFYAQIMVLYCGSERVGWDEILQAITLFNTPQWKQAINEAYSPGSNSGRGSQSQYYFAQILATQGQQSLLYRQTIHQMPAPITVMRQTRSKLAARPLDKILGVLSLLGENIRSSLPPDFTLIPKEAFTEVVTSMIKEWAVISYFLFATFLSKRLGGIPLDQTLQRHCKLQYERKQSRAREVVQRYFGDRMMGRCFCVLGGEETSKRIGMGTGYMGIGDLVAIAHGCSTPIVLRPTDQGKYVLVGDIYVDGYMDGEAIYELRFVKGMNVVLC